MRYRNQGCKHGRHECHAGTTKNPDMLRVDRNHLNAMSINHLNEFHSVRTK